MDVTYDPAKDAINIRKHGISLARAAEFDFLAADVTEDNSQDYGEVRYIAIGFLAATLHVFIFTTNGIDLHAISLRKAKRPERNIYAEAH